MSGKILLFKARTKERSDIMCTILKKIQGKSAPELLLDNDVELKPPIDIEKLVSRIGISIFSMDFSSIESEVGIERGSILGATILNDDGINIYHKYNDSENRKRFTIAHEIAHCCLHTDSLMDHHVELRGKFNNCETEEYREKEYEANVFAGKLLIPEKPLKLVYDQLLIPSLEILAEIFKVSTTVMAARLDYLHMTYLKDADLTEV